MAFADGIDPGIHVQELLQTLEAISPKLQGREDDISFVKNVVARQEFVALLKLHQEVTCGPVKAHRPVTLNALEVAHTLAYELDQTSSTLTREVVDLLYSHHVDALMAAHDHVANKEFPEQFLNNDADQTRSVRVVRLQKDNNPLGATIKRNKNGQIAIARVLHGSVADKSGLLNVGDSVLAVNGTSVEGKTVDEVADTLQAIQGLISFKIMPENQHCRRRARRQPVVKVRTHFSYSASVDQELPCQEAGLSFERGEILYVVNQEDPAWWQAVRKGETVISGLIPSLLQQQKKEYAELVLNSAHKKTGTLSTLRRKVKSRKLVYDASAVQELSAEEVLPYEEVVKIAPQNNRPRPIFLVSAHSEVKAQAVINHMILNQTQGVLFSLPGKRSHPSSVARRDVVSVHEVLQVMETGKTAILSIPPQAVKMYRVAELKPFVIFLRPPPISEISQLTPSEARRKSRESQVVEARYAHFLDQVIIFSDVQTAAREVVKTAERLRKDFQWVPSSWVHK